MEEKKFTEFESFDNEQLQHLQNALGFGAIVIDWKDIDFDLGRGVGKNQDRSIWGKDGRRIDIFVGGGSFGASQTQEPDSLYVTYKEEYDGR